MNLEALEFGLLSHINKFERGLDQGQFVTMEKLSTLTGIDVQIIQSELQLSDHYQPSDVIPIDEIRRALKIYLLKVMQDI
jgi:hypothetical protein